MKIKYPTSQKKSWDKSHNLSKTVLVLLSASVERVFVSRMQELLFLFTISDIDFF